MLIIHLQGMQTENTMKNRFTDGSHGEEAWQPAGMVADAAECSYLQSQAGRKENNWNFKMDPQTPKVLLHQGHASSAF